MRWDAVGVRAKAPAYHFLVVVDELHARVLVQQLFLVQLGLLLQDLFSSDGWPFRRRGVVELPPGAALDTN